MIRRVLQALLGAFLVAGGITLGSGTAHAANGCGGTLVGVYPVGDVGEVNVYWEASTQTNCLVNLNLFNGSSIMNMSITAWSPYDSDTDSGNFWYYAGPVRVYAPDACINFDAKSGGYYRSERNIHCG